tara:strand:+ start:6343 stop:7128 length:786 start_codon:yes stop_codon:yes gene_type:complete
MEKLNKDKFKNWKDYYFEYQRTLASSYYIPFLINNNVELKDKNILEIGCGNGGFISAFGDFSDHCVGFDLKNLDWKENNVKYRQLDVFDDKLVDQIDSKFDIIILRDVIEHLDNKQTDKLFKQIELLSKSNALVLITFPPFYSPFGLHQQVLLKSMLRFIPYLSLIPKDLIKVLTEEDSNKDGVEELLSLYDSKKTISMFYKLINNHRYRIIDEKFFHIRPSHQIRYGLKTIESKLIWHIPIIRELLITGTVFLINNRRVV